MPLFEREETEFGTDVGTRVLSRTPVEHDFVERVYENLSSVYDLTFGPLLHPGRLFARDRMALKPGDRLLEVGVGTGINLSLYPSSCHVTGIDLSAPMLEKAYDRVTRKGLKNIRLAEMDATSLTFPDSSFDVVYAPYLVSVVPDPLPVVREMRRVCRPGGRIVILNHFLSTNPLVRAVERTISPLTLYVGFKADLDLPTFLEQADLKPISIEKVSLPIWDLVTCIKS